MGFFSYFFGKDENQQSNNAEPTIQTVDCRCIYCDHVCRNELGEICCNELGETMTPAGTTVSEIEYMCKCEGYRFRPLYGDAKNIGTISPRIL